MAERHSPFAGGDRPRISIQLRVGSSCDATSTLRGASSGRRPRPPPIAREVCEVGHREGRSRRDPVSEGDAEQCEGNAPEEAGRARAPVASQARPGAVDRDRDDADDGHRRRVLANPSAETTRPARRVPGPTGASARTSPGRRAVTAMPTPNWKKVTINTAVAAKPARRRSGAFVARPWPKTSKNTAKAASVGTDTRGSAGAAAFPSARTQPDES